MSGALLIAGALLAAVSSPTHLEIYVVPGPTRTFTARPTYTPIPRRTPCPGDVDHSGTVTIDELIRAINAAMEGCPQ